MTKKIPQLLLFCEKWYSTREFTHALRVANYAFEMAKASAYVDSENAFLVGLAHDLIEDTECPQEVLMEILGEDLFSDVSILTKDDRMSYDDYMKEILTYGGDLAILVKRADLKDHFMQWDTLTSGLKEKYTPWIGKFL